MSLFAVSVVYFDFTMIIQIIMMLLQVSETRFTFDYNHRASFCLVFEALQMSPCECYSVR